MTLFEMQLEQYLYGQTSSVSLLEEREPIKLPEMMNECYYCNNCQYISSKAPCERCEL